MGAWGAVLVIALVGLALLVITLACLLRLVVNVRELVAASRYKRQSPSGSRYNYVSYLGSSRLQLIVEAATPRGFPTPALVHSKEECFAYLEISRGFAYNWLLGKEAVTLLAASAAGAAVGAAVTDYQSKGWESLLKQTLPDYAIIFMFAVVLIALALAFQETRLGKWRQVSDAYRQRMRELP